MPTHQEKIQEACGYIKQHTPNFTPEVGIVLGSGLGPLAEEIEQSITLSYDEIPHFPSSSVDGHAGNLIIGELCGKSVICMQGRVHRYEGAQDEDFKILFRTFKQLGCETMIITSASGSLREDIKPGELVLITDHINMQLTSPLIGQNDEEFGPRFLAMDDAYSKDLRKIMHKSAVELDLLLHEGINMSVFGPCFETPAEIRAFRTLGADVINMSMVPEVIVSRHCGLNVAALGVVTNFGAGMGKHIDHDDNLKHAQMAADNFKVLMKSFLQKL